MKEINLHLEKANFYFYATKTRFNFNRQLQKNYYDFQNLIKRPFLQRKNKFLV